MEVGERRRATIKFRFNGREIEAPMLIVREEEKYKVITETPRTIDRVIWLYTGEGDSVQKAIDDLQKKLDRGDRGG